MIKKYLKEIIIAALIILLLSISYCSHNQQKIIEGEKMQLKEQLIKEVDGVKIYRKEQKLLFDSISLAEKVKEKRISELNMSNQQLNASLKNSQKELEQKKNSYENKSFEQLAQVFREIGYKDIESTNTSVNLLNYTPMEVLDDLAEGSACFKDLDTNKSIIKNKDEEIVLIQEKVLNRDLQIASKQVETEKLDAALKLSEDINSKSEKEIRKLKTKNFVNRILVPIAFIGGGYLGLQLSK